jgi:hypothetical protein
LAVGSLTLILHLPGCASLKEKRGRLKPLLARLHREFNISVAEVDRQDAWQEAVVACALVSNDAAHIQRSFDQVTRYTETHFPDIQLVDQQFELI